MNYTYTASHCTACGKTFDTPGHVCDVLGIVHREESQLDRIEHKLDMIIEHLGLKQPDDELLSNWIRRSNVRD